jgi:Xaa-Pro aminopeptidase
MKESMKEFMFIDEFELDISENIFPFVKSRRERLLEQVKKRFSEKKGVIVLSGSFLQLPETFVQDSTFWYFTGISEPGCVLTISLEDGKAILFVPHYHSQKQQWDVQHVTKDSDAEGFLFDEIRPLGEEIVGLTVSPRLDATIFSNLKKYLQEVLQSDGYLFTIFPHDATSYAIDIFLQYVKKEAEITEKQYVNIAQIVTEMRMKKDEQEIARLYNAIDVTTTAFEAAMGTIRGNITEAEVQASAEFVMTANGCKRAFPTIVASGKNATILHYHENRGIMKQGELVLIDMGARFDYYCADLSRTIPVSGTFSKRQKELYLIVLEVQEHIAQMAAPGMFLHNKLMPEQSLHHQAIAVFKAYQLDQYFVHGIGHHVGLDVHDVADHAKPLEVGNVITIEPGLYIKEEHVGIRIEDNYMITENGAVCLSENLPKTVQDIERAMQNQTRDFEDDLFLNSSVFSEDAN